MTDTKGAINGTRVLQSKLSVPPRQDRAGA